MEGESIPFTNQQAGAIIDIVNCLDAPLTQAVGILIANFLI
jgi:hypothetical protein